jgi:predicted SAM-dependent methyltransferase
MLMLHIGCGDVYFDGWVNLDLDSPKADRHHDMHNPLPYADQSVGFIYNEHFIEHMTVAAGLAALKECYRVLQPGGALRIATPDLRYILFRYFFFWKRQDWLKTYGYEWIQTKAEMVNIGMREWGHQYVYDEEELRRRLQEAGFAQIARKKLNQSDFDQLRRRETRKDSKLILEAIK